MFSARSSIAALAVAVLLAPVPLHAQQAAKVYRIGMLCPPQCVPTHPLWPPFMQGIRDLGWVEGQNFVIEFRHAMGRAEQLPALAAELVAAKVDVLVAPSASAAQALKDATRTIPIVFVGVGDPVQAGFVASMARPGGNMTGLTVLTGPEFDAKRLELLRQAVPAASRVAVLSIPTEPGNTGALQELDVAARTLRVQLLRTDVRVADDLEPAFSTLAKEGAAALLVLGAPLTTAQGPRVNDLAAKYRIPTMVVTRELVRAGTLMSYGPNFGEVYRRAGYYVDKILRGVKPADLPVEQPTKFELIINLRVARTLGLAIPQSLLQRADEVIE